MGWTYPCLLPKLFSSSPPFAPLHLPPPLHGFFTHLSILPCTTCSFLHPHLPWPSLLSHFHYLLHHTSKIFRILLKITMLSLLPDTYSLIQAYIPMCKEQFEVARSAGVNPSRPADASCAMLPVELVSTHTLHLQLGLVQSVPGKCGCLRVGCSI